MSPNVTEDKTSSFFAPNEQLLYGKHSSSRDNAADLDWLSTNVNVWPRPVVVPAVVPAVVPSTVVPPAAVVPSATVVSPTVSTAMTVPWHHSAQKHKLAVSRCDPTTCRTFFTIQ
jgi:hypothetical protein